jgi:hypothetical protein
VIGIKEVITARSSWQNPHVVRLIGSIRRECLDHIIIMGPEPISRSTRIVRSLAAFSLPLQVRLSPSRRSVVCIIATNVAPRER